jgi:hypothetical protein
VAFRCVSNAPAGKHHRGVVFSALRKICDGSFHRVMRASPAMRAQQVLRRCPNWQRSLAQTQEVPGSNPGWRTSRATALRPAEQSRSGCLARARFASACTGRSKGVRSRELANHLHSRERRHVRMAPGEARHGIVARVARVQSLLVQRRQRPARWSADRGRHTVTTMRDARDARQQPGVALLKSRVA